MCQLLGICCNSPTDLRFSFRGWRYRGDSNPHGYGFAHWDADGPRVEKSPSNLYHAAASETKEVTAARSSIFLCHVRLKSVGVRDGVNTHPFQAASQGRQFVFAHNGTVCKVKAWPLAGRCPDGQTDSEHAFLWLLEQLPEPTDASFTSRLRESSDAVRELGWFNFLLSDGETLWAYADNSLHFVERTPPYGGELVQLLDDGYTISLAEVKRPRERAVLVATEPLTDEASWEQLSCGELLVVRDGKVEERLP